MNLNETDKFLEKYNLPKLTQDKVENSYSPTSAKKNKIYQKSPQKETLQVQMISLLNSIKYLNKK